MPKKNPFNELLDTALAQDSKLGDMVASVRQPAVHEITSDERRVVDVKRNAQRGRGKKKEGRVMIAFHAPIEKEKRIEDLCYALGNTKNELYNEALDLLIKKYKNI